MHLLLLGIVVGTREKSVNQTGNKPFPFPTGNYIVKGGRRWYRGDHKLITYSIFMREQSKGKVKY